ncbi:MAG TPA: response regulator, partial [Nannocystis sp.]
RDRAQGGLGIGLTLARRLVELHGGRIVADSAGPGQGCRMTVHLPLAPQAVPDLAAEAPPDTPALDDNGQRIVIVEDNDDVREMLRYLLESIGHEVDEAADGVQGIAKVAELQPDVALVDIGLPGLDGFEVARRLRASGAVSGTLLIALTGYGLEKDREAVLEAGFDRHLTKPVEPDLLIQILQEHREARRKRKL